MHNFDTDLHLSLFFYKKLDLIVSYKRIGNYRTLIDTKLTKICDYIGNGSTFSPLGEYMKKHVFRSLPTCPLEGSAMQLNNLSYSPSEAAVWPDGFYRVIQRYKDKSDDNIFSVMSEAHIRNIDNIEEF